MLYLKIPPGMVYKQVTAIDEAGKSLMEDQFVTADPTKPRRSISIQEIVFQFLTTHKSSAEINGIHVSKKRPNYCGDLLEYRAIRNGKEPSNHSKFIGNTSPSVPKGILTGYASWWAQEIPLSTERREALEESRDEQRANRRHWGPCPNAT